MKYFLLILLFVLSMQAEELKKVSVQFQWKHQFEYAGFYAAIEQGYYRDLGLEVELKEIGPQTDLIKDVLEQKSDFAISYSSVVAEYYKGKPIVMLANIFKHSALVLISQKEIFTPSDLRGKKVMGSSVELSNTGIAMMLNNFDLGVNDFNTIKQTHSIEPFINRDVDAMTAFITNQPYQLNQKHIHYNILSPSNYGSQFYDVNLFTSKKFFEDDPETVRAFTEATIKGWAYALKHTDKIIQLILEQYNTQNKSYEALKYEAEVTCSLILPDIYPLGSIDCNVIQNMKKNFIEMNMIDKNTTMKEADFLLEHTCVTKLNSEFTSQEKSYLLSKSEITVCVDPDWMPLEMIKNGEIVGMSAEYLKLISSKTGVKFTLVPTTTWSESVIFAKERKCDVFSLAMSTPKRKKYMNFTTPHLSIPLVIATTTDKLFITDFEDRVDETFGVVEGYAFTELLKIKYPELKIRTFKNIEEGLKAVNRGEIYGFIDNLTTLSYQIQKGYIGALKITGQIDDKWELGIGVRNDDLMLLNVLDKAILSIDEKEKQRILNAWMSVTYEKGVDYALIWKILLIAFLFFLLGFYRYRVMHGYNKELKLLNKKLELLSTTDALTDIFNRRFLDHSLHDEYTRAQRYKGDFALILIDVDDFKAVNDTYGHDKGDEVLKKVAKTLLECSRKSDIVGRWGGEEFMIICPSTNSEGALNVANKMREEIQNLKYDFDDRITASFGVLLYNNSQSYHWHITSVDQALYEAKYQGKNQVQMFEQSAKKESKV